MSSLITDWQRKKHTIGEQAGKTLLYLSKQKARAVNLKANQFYAEIMKELDCLNCANCCSGIPPIVNEADAKRIAKFLGVKFKRFQEEYLTKDEDRDTVLKTVPCVFLEKDHTCIIYEARPKACREYPHIDEFQFMKNLKLHLTNVSYFPIVYHTLEQFKKNGMSP